MMRREMGVTLVELLVVLAILGVMAGLVGLSWKPALWTTNEESASAIADAVRQAVASGKPVPITVTNAGRSVPVIAFPDGRVIGAAQVGVDPLTGTERDAPGP